MKSLKELFDIEMRSSMLFLCVGISVAVSLLVGFFQFQQLRFDFSLTEHFVAESTKNVLVLEEPIMIQRSMSEFWKAFEERGSAITGFDVYFDEALVSQNGFKRGKTALLQLETKRCFPSSQQDICLRYFIDPIRFLSELISVLLAVVVGAFSVYFLRGKLAEKNIAALSQPLELEIAKITAISEGFKTAMVASAGVETLAGVLPIQEVARLSEAYKDLLEYNREFLVLEKSVAVTKSLGALASQVAHDIRSPLAALEVVSGDVDQLPEDKRVLIRAAVGRIRDIANSLLSRQRAHAVGAEPSAPEAASPHLLSSLIDPVISEKRLQFRSQSRIAIELRLDISSYGLFAAVQPIEFKRLVSNLVNNAVEAVGDGDGAVRIALTSRDGHALVSVQDNGKGIPAEVLAKLGRRGETHGKADGSGLGLYHARTSAEAWGGSLEIASEVGKGTTSTVLLPLAPAPEWFVSALRLSPGKTVVILDDDVSVHRVWQKRLEALKVSEKGVEVIHVSSPDEIRGWVKTQPVKAHEALYLFDYELSGHRETGLSLAAELELGAQVVVVTSHCEEPDVLADCRRLKVRLLPKGLAGSVPMSVEAPPETCVRERLDAVLIDDDPLTRMTWMMSAVRQGKKLRAFSSSADFLKESDSIDRETPVYVDAELGDGAKGDVETLRIHGLGFGEIYIATGYEPEKFKGFKHLRGVIGKNPPWSAGDGVNSDFPANSPTS